MIWAASKYLLQVREKSQWAALDESHYTQHDTREQAVAALIARETEALEAAERNLKRQKARLAAFIKRERSK